MPTGRDKEALAKYWEDQKRQGNLAKTLGKPVKRGRGRPRSLDPLRRITIRVDEATMFRVKLLAREHNIPWQRMIRTWLRDQSAQQLRDLRRTQADAEQSMAVNAQPTMREPLTSDERIGQADRLIDLVQRTNIRTLLVPVPTAA